MRVLNVAWVPLLAMSAAMAHGLQERFAGALERHGEVHHMKRQGGIVGGIVGQTGEDGPDDTSTSSASTSLRTPTSLTSPVSTTSTPITTLTTVPPTTASPLSTTVSSPLSSTVLSNTTASLNHTISANMTSTNTSSASSTVPLPSTSVAQSTYSIDAQGQTVIVTRYTTPSSSSTTAVAVAASSSAPAAESSPGISTAAIVGISVAVGVVVLSLIGCAVWRMKRRSGDEDEVIRWPELNRHGDSDAHHALPARQTGQHGIETSPLERSLSNSSSVYHSSLARGPSTHMGSTAMALNGSNFGAANSLDYYDEKAYAGHTSVYDGYDNYAQGGPHSGADDAYGGAPLAEDYSSMPPPMQHAHSSHGVTAPGYNSDEETAAAPRHGAY